MATVADRRCVYSGSFRGLRCPFQPLRGGSGGRGKLDAVFLLMPCLRISHLRRLRLRMAGNMFSGGFFLQVIDLLLPVFLAMARETLNVEPKSVHDEHVKYLEIL